MSYVRPNIVSGATRLTKELVDDITKGIEDAHEELDGRLSETELNGTYAPASVAAEIAAVSDEIAQAVNPGGSVVSVDGVATRYTDPTRPINATATLSFWGHSLIYSNNGVFEAQVASLLGCTTTNNGVGGQTSTDIAIRKGGIIPLITLTGGNIPATTDSTIVSEIIPTGDFRDNSSSGTYEFFGTLAGIPGKLVQTLTTRIWSFVRTTAGSVTAVPARTPFLITTDQRNTDVTVILPGRNNIYTPAANFGTVIRDIDAMVGTLTPYNRRFVVLAELNSTEEKIGATGYHLTNRNNLLTNNAERAAKYGQNYFDIRAEFISRGLALAGITPTTADNAAVAADSPPPSLMAAGDPVHPNTAGYQVLGTLLAEWLVARGWYTYASTTVPGAPTGLSATAGNGQIALAWTAPASNGGSAITDYVVQRSPDGGTTWTTFADGVGVGLNATITSLTNGTAYLMRVAAVNAIGQSAWSSTVSATPTTGSATVYWSDDFNRADAAVWGNTPVGGLAWTLHGGTGTPTASIVSNKGKLVGSSTNPVYYGVQDSHADGVLRATLDAVDATPNVSVYFRMGASTADCFEIRRVSSTELRWRLIKNVGGVSTTLAISTVGTFPIQAGNVFEVTLNGTAVMVKIDGATLYSGTQTDLATNTKAGLTGTSDSVLARWENVSFASA
ncbi:fibronectin type III domain-containing protein [Rhodococcus qingshengii]